jgi:small subunit ribosomal protein S35
MATVIQSLRIAARRPLAGISAPAHSARPFGRQRYFKTFSSRREDDAGKESGAETLSSDNTDSDELPPSTQTLEEAFVEIIKKHGRIRQNMPEELKNAPPFREMRPLRPRAGALNMGVDPSENPEEDPEFEEDDITSLAHGQLEQHREYRHYARLAAWEMPLLTSKISILVTWFNANGLPRDGKRVRTTDTKGDLKVQIYKLHGRAASGREESGRRVLSG